MPPSVCMRQSACSNHTCMPTATTGPKPATRLNRLQGLKQLQGLKARVTQPSLLSVTNYKLQARHNLCLSSFANYDMGCTSDQKRCLSRPNLCKTNTTSSNGSNTSKHCLCPSVSHKKLLAHTYHTGAVPGWFKVVFCDVAWQQSEVECGGPACFGRGSLYTATSGQKFDPTEQLFQADKE